MIKKKVFKTALGLAVLALFTLPIVTPAGADNIVELTNAQIGGGADFNSSTHVVDINATTTGAGTINVLYLSSIDFATPPATPIKIGDFTLTAGNANTGGIGGNLGFAASTVFNPVGTLIDINAKSITMAGGTASGTNVGGHINAKFKNLTVTNNFTMVGNGAANTNMHFQAEKLTVGGNVDITGSSHGATNIYIKNGTYVTGDFILKSVDSTTATSINYNMNNTTVTDNVLDVTGNILLTGSQNAGSIVIGAGTSNISVKSTGNLILNGEGGTTSLAVGLSATTEVLDIAGNVELLAGNGNATISGTTGSNFKANIGGDLKITTSGSGKAVFAYAPVNGTDNKVNVGGNVYIGNGSITGNSLASFQHGNLVNIGKNVTIESLAAATSTNSDAASFVVHGTTGDNIFGGDVTLSNAATTGTNVTSMLLSTVDKNIIAGNLTLISTYSNANSITYFNAGTGTTQINGGSLTMKGFNGATYIDNTDAIFDTLDFSNSTGADVNIENGRITLYNLNVAGGKANTFNFIDIENELIVNNGILTVGNEKITGAGGTLTINSIVAVDTSIFEFEFEDATFYLSGLKGGDVSLTIAGSIGGTTPIIDVSKVNNTNVQLALTGNKLKAGETLTLITGKIKGDVEGNPVQISNTNIMSNAKGKPLNSSFYSVDDYTVHWDANNSLILGLSATAVTNPDGSLGNNTNNIWFIDLEALATTGNDNIDYLTGKDLTNLDTANNQVKPYDNLSPNAKELYKDLAFKTQETGYEDYKWADTPEANDSRQALEDYFVIVVPKLVDDYNNTHGGTPKTKDDYILAFMNDLDPFIHSVGGLHISRVVVDSMDIILDNANTSNSSLAYAQSVAAGENTDYWRIWAKTSATWDKLANQGFYAGYTGSHFAGYLGGDRNFGNARIGLAIGAGKSKLDWDNNAETEADNIIAKLYGEYDYNNFTFGASIGGGNTSVEAERYVAGTKRKADYDVSMFAFDIYSKYNHKTENFEFTPEIGLSYLKTKQDSFTERGAAGMYFDTLKNDSALAYLKVTANVPVELENGIILKPRANAGISHEIADNNATIRSSFIGQPGQFVNNKGPELKRTSVDVGVGLEANFTNDVSAYIQYDAQIQSDYKRQTASAGLEFRF